MMHTQEEGKSGCCWDSDPLCCNPEERLSAPQPSETFVDFKIILRSENPRGTPFSTWRVSAEVTTKLGISLS